MRRLLGLTAFVALFGCGGGSNPALTVHPTITVHTGITTGGQSNIISARVLIGDGTQHDLPVDANGDAIFKDVNLTGPQTVTVVEQRSNGNVAVVTAVGVNLDDVYLNLGYSTSTYVPPSTLGTIAGSVTGTLNSADSVFVYAMSPYYGGASANADGSYSFDVSGTDAGTTSVIAREDDSSTGNTVAIGMATNVTVGGSVGGVVVPLDHPLDQTFSVAVDNLASVASSMDVELEDRLDLEQLFNQQGSGASPIQLHTIAPTGVFANVTQRLMVSAGDPTVLPAGRMLLHQNVTGSSVDLTLPSPVTLSSPAFGATAAQAPAVPLSGLKLAWSAGSPWQAIGLELIQGKLDWEVLVPPSASAFTFPALPADASPLKGFTTGSAVVVASGVSYDGISSYDGFFASDADSKLNQDGNDLTNELGGYLTLQ